jgi:hypothetical protein
MYMKDQRTKGKFMKLGFTFTLFILVHGLLSPTTANAAMLGHWAPSVKSVITSQGDVRSQQIIVVVAHLNAATVRFEALVKAYSINHELPVEEQLFDAADDFSGALSALNTVLSEVYPDLSDADQLIIDDAYGWSSSYLNVLATQANSVQDIAVFTIPEVTSYIPVRLNIELLGDGIDPKS